MERGVMDWRKIGLGVVEVVMVENPSWWAVGAWCAVWVGGSAWLAVRVATGPRGSHFHRFRWYPGPVPEASSESPGARHNASSYSATLKGATTPGECVVIVANPQRSYMARAGAKKSSSPV